MNPLRIAVVGGGRLGRIHARLLGQNPDFFLAAVVDPLEKARQEIAAECKALVLPSHRPLLGQIDAAVVAATTSEHYAVGRELVRAGVHVLMEKPIAATTAEAAALVEAAEAKHVVLQVGHVERFNPAFEAVSKSIEGPRLLRAVRRSGYTGRSTDIGVVLDLMIHDIDLALSLVPGPVVDVQASGRAVFGPHEDIAEARLSFACGASATFYASRVSFDPCRRIEIDAEGGMAIVDLQARAAKLALFGEKLREQAIDVESLTSEQRAQVGARLFQDADLAPLAELPVADTNPIAEQHDDFAAAIRERRPCRVDGHQGLAALTVAERIVAQIASANRQTSTSRQTSTADRHPPAVTVPFPPPGERRKAG